jgi:hypothetical protein
VTTQLLPNRDLHRIGDWIQTYSGKCFWPLDPRHEEVELRDIAHALSMKCRYAGHVKRFYSVAEHSVLVSMAVPAEFALDALLHDAAEAYSSDIPRPLKKSLTEWDAIEARIFASIAVRFGLTRKTPACVKDIDFAITANERAALMTPCARDWALPPAVPGVEIQALDPWHAEQAFLERYYEIISFRSAA